MWKRLAGILSVLLLTAGVASADCDTTRSGLWTDNDVWTDCSCGASGYPDDDCDVNILDGHTITYDVTATTTTLEADSIIIDAGGALIMPRGSFLDVGADADTSTSDIGGITVNGYMSIAAATVRVHPNGNDDAREDGITVGSGGYLNAVGLLHTRGKVESFASDAGDSVGVEIISGTDDTGSGDAITLNDTGGFTGLDLVGDLVYNLTDNSWGYITANTDNTVTTSMSSGVWNAADEYGIYRQDEDGCTDITFKDSLTPLADCDETADPGSCNGLVLVWLDGERKGSWYDLESVSGGDTITLQCDSRHNNERRGEPIIADGTVDASVGSTLTGTSTDFETASNCSPRAPGSYFMCDDDTFASEATIIKSTTSDTAGVLVENYKGDGGCSSASDNYIIVDMNQPWNALNINEQINIGDNYIVIEPSVITSGTQTYANPDNQIFVEFADGSNGQIKYTSITYAGSYEQVDNDGWALEINTDDVVLDTFEISDFGGQAALRLDSADDTTVKRGFIHRVADHHETYVTTATGDNPGHGIEITGTSNNIRIEDTLVERIGDDCFWKNGETTGTSGVFDSICKYPGILETSSSVDGMDMAGTFGGQFTVARNLFTNFGASDCSGSGAVSLGISSQTVPSWSDPGLVVQDNSIFNLQAGKCFSGSHTAPVVAGIRYDNQDIFYVNNICAYSNTETCMDRVPRFYQNTCLDLGAALEAGANSFMVQDPYEIKGNIIACEDNVNDGACSGIQMGTDLTRYVWTNTQFAIEDNVITNTDPNSIKIQAWADATYPASSTFNATITHNLIIGEYTDTGTSYSINAFSGADGTNNQNVDIFDNLIENFPRNGEYCAIGDDKAGITWNYNFCNAERCTRSTPNCLFTTDPETGLNFSSGTTGLAPGALDFNYKTGSDAASATTTDTTNVGPRFAGTLGYRIPWIRLMKKLPPIVDPLGTRTVDTDGDGLIDFWDNCDTIANLGWKDTDGDGIGDACE